MPKFSKNIWNTTDLAGDLYLRGGGDGDRLLGGDPGRLRRGGRGESPLRRIGGDLLRGGGESGLRRGEAKMKY